MGNGKDSIIIENLEIYAHHGVYKEEKNKGQHFYVNAELKTDLSRAGQSDCLEDSTDYGAVCQQIRESLTEQTFDLIERAAQKTAEDILRRFGRIDEITLELCKPQAPVAMNFDSISVKITRGWHKVYVGFGSNMGDRISSIHKALEHIANHPRFRRVKKSDIYTTTPYGVTQQEDFLNGVLEAETLMDPRQLLTYLQQEEALAGRERKEHWGPRTLDLDILFYDDLILDEENLQIPHKDMANRDFVLRPLSDLAPYKRHPLTKKTVEEMLNELKEHHIIE